MNPLYPILAIRRKHGEEALRAHQLTPDEHAMFLAFDSATSSLPENSPIIDYHRAAARVGATHGLSRWESVAFWTRTTFGLFESRHDAVERRGEVRDPVLRAKLVKQWADRPYTVFVCLGRPAGPPIWSWHSWRRVALAIDPLLQLARGTAGVRVHQYDSATRQEVPLGRLSWSEAGHAKWTHGSPHTVDRSSTWVFEDFEMWAPNPTQCEREDLPPDIFFAIDPGPPTSPGEAKTFCPVILLAVADDIPDLLATPPNTVFLQICETVQPLLLASRVRTWARAEHGVCFADSIQDLLPSSLYRAWQEAHTQPITLATLNDAWEPVHGGA